MHSVAQARHNCVIFSVGQSEKQWKTRSCLLCSAHDNECRDDEELGEKMRSSNRQINTALTVMSGGLGRGGAQYSWCQASGREQYGTITRGRVMPAARVAMAAGARSLKPAADLEHSCRLARPFLRERYPSFPGWVAAHTKDRYA